MKTCILIPCYRHGKALGAVLERLRAFSLPVIVIDDGCTGEDREALLKAVATFTGSVTLCTHENNQGKGAALITGFRKALSLGFTHALQVDADGQHDPSYIAPMVENMVSTGADIVIGSRFLTEKKHLSARMTGSALIQFMVRLTTGRKLSDPTSGMRLYGKGMIERFARESDFGPEPDTVAYLIRQGAKVSEVQVSMRDRTAGESYLSFTKSISYMLRTCISILFVQWFR